LTPCLSLPVVGPSFVTGEDAASIVDIVLKYDKVNSSNRIHFREKVVERMRRGLDYYTRFTRTKANGEQQDLYMTYAPVMLRSLRAINHSDFSAGVEARDSLVYALGFGIATSDLAFAYQEVKDKVNRDIDQVTYISLALIIGALLMVM
jgi:hypothetical protein